VSRILNGTLVQSGYTVPFTLDVLENTERKTNLKYRQYTTKHNPKAKRAKYSKTKLP